MNSKNKQRFETLINKQPVVNKKFFSDTINVEDFTSWAISCLSLLESVFGKESVHYINFYKQYNNAKGFMANNFSGWMLEYYSNCKAIFKAAYDDFKNDYTSTSKSQSKNNKSRIFIVHGHDDAVKNEVARFLEKLELEPIILHEQSSDGRTIIEKIEKYSDVGFGIILYTPCDLGKDKNNEKLNARARQNVIFEHGYLIGKIGRSNVCALVKEDNLEKPTDISGVVYISMDNSWKIQLSKEMKSAGYEIDMNKVI
ncbi:MAG: nucleotide-binding protein [Fusobacteriaceae bacterium]|nr:nucleotide-binding protein [Fusobacteriaceae bacterium]